MQSSVLGNFTSEIPKLKIDDETHDVLRRLATQCGMNLTEFCREVLIVRAHGIERVQSLYHRRFDLVAGIDADKGSDGE